MSTPEQLFSDLLAASPGRPFVTYYDEASGERAELSVKSLANWVAKTHHLIVTELGLGAGDRGLVAVPAHWISVPVLLGALTAGLELTDEASEAAVAFVAPDTFAQGSGVPDLYIIAPQSAAVGFKGAEPAGAIDYVSAVRPQADTWPSVQFGAGPNEPCFAGRTRAEVAEWARERAASLGLAPGARVLSTREWITPADWIDAVLAPLSVGGSLLLVRNADGPTLERRADQERATVRL